MPFRTMNLNEAAAYLHLPAQTLQDLARRGEIPCRKTGSRLVFTQSSLDEWASQRLLAATPERLRDYHRQTTAKYRDLSPEAAIIPTLIKPEWIEPALASRTKNSVIRQMVELADRTGLVCQREELLESLIEREKLCPTAMPGGLALLHPRHQAPYRVADSFLCLGRTVSPLPFGAPDGSLTDLFFLICCQDERIHLHVLARLCMMSHRGRLLDLLRQAPSPGEMYQHLVDAEQETLGQIQSG